MAMKFSLKFVPIISSNSFNSERKVLDNMIDEVNGACLGMLLINFQCSHTSAIIYGSILISLELFAVFIFKKEELNIYLNVMA